MTAEEALTRVKAMVNDHHYRGVHAILHVDASKPDGYRALTVHFDDQTFLLRAEEVPEGASMSELLERAT